MSKLVLKPSNPLKPTASPPEVEKISLPFIVVQGSEDKIVDPGGRQMLYDKASSADKTIKIYDGLYHEVFNEPERAQVLKNVETWLAAHV